MLHDEDLDLRETAAGALRKLTGRSVEVPRPALEFPASVPEAAPLGEPRKDHRTQPLCARFGTWFDGAPCLLQSADDVLEAVGRDGIPGDSRKLPDRPVDVLALDAGAGGRFWVVAARAGEFGRSAHHVACLDAELHERWRFQPGRADEVAMTPIRGPEGDTGVVLGFGGDDGVVGLDLKGEKVFSLWKPVVYEVDSHPAVPDRIVVCGGEIAILDGAGRPVVPPGTPKPAGTPYLYAHHAQAFPDEQGFLAVIASGVSWNSAPILMRLDDRLQKVWSATLPTEVDGLALVERTSGGRLFVAALAGGELLVFDADGALYPPLRLAEPPPPGDRVAVYAVDSGRYGDGTPAVAITLLKQTLVYPVN
jgi:hypothetical protein